MPYSDDDGAEMPSDFESPGFRGSVRLLPLPQLVMFPYAMQGLRISDPADCELLTDALSSDRMIAIATLRGGVAATDAVMPPLHPMACVCKVVSHTQTDTQGHNILLVGSQRVILEAEVGGDLPYRVARARGLQGTGASLAAATSYSSGVGEVELKRQVLEAFADLLPAAATVQQNLHELMSGQMELSAITDIIAFMLPLPLETKLSLLAELDVGRRAEMLVRCLSQQATLSGAQGGFPPRFSVN